MSTNTNVSNLTLNKKGTKVKITGLPKLYNILGTGVQWIPSFVYLGIKFDLFTFENEGYAITGWGVVFVVGLFLAFRQKLKASFKEYAETFGSSWERAKSGNIALAIASTLFVVYFASLSLFMIFFIYAGSTYLSLLLYAPYDALSEKRKEMQALLDEKRKKEDFNALTQEFEQLNA